MAIHLPFRNIEPVFFAGLFDDPILLLRIKTTGRHLMFDCGQVHHLAKRNFTRLDAIFISHAHMDHWMGIDHVIRHLITADRIVKLFGPPGIADKFDCKLRGYDWNLAEDDWCRFRVHDVYPDRVVATDFCGPEGFTRKRPEEYPREGTLIYETLHCHVHALSCQHGIESLIFRVDEIPVFSIDLSRLKDLGLSPGPWLSDLKKYFFKRQLESALPVPQEGSSTPVHFESAQLDELISHVIETKPVATLGFVSDIGGTDDNLEAVRRLFPRLDLLLCECTFLKEDLVKARAAKHLCSHDINIILKELRPHYFLPMHLSKSYRENPRRLYRQIDVPDGTRLLSLPQYVTQRPLQMGEIHWNEVEQQ